eukprot:COSAG02_NODE_41529_length_393_cov_1.411565_1_plen_115_part_10
MALIQLFFGSILVAADRRLLLALDAVSDGFSRADLGYIAQPPGHYVKPPRAKEVGFRRRVDISENVRKEDYVVLRLEQLVAAAQSKDWHKHLLPQPPPWVSCASGHRTTRGLAAA